ncbi:hypothetical protein PFNF135_05355 [Plasmodium falciparum NF135/5.C10]|uniref:Btz domain-containing protein n=1 Tax=Plasmodium falciparum NF135/5.C10 TaxID=1036726 RepID=W4I9D2_PLAFA|nr:hypothetical protein PFNF135_05355 [Plasmodium falciparum NF135/5.C10]
MDVKNLRSEYILEEENNVFEDYKSYISDSVENKSIDFKNDLSSSCSKNINEEYDKEEEEAEEGLKGNVYENKNEDKKEEKLNDRTNEQCDNINVNKIKTTNLINLKVEDNKLEERNYNDDNNKINKNTTTNKMLQDLEDKNYSIKEKMKEDPCYVPKESGYFLHDNRFENNEKKLYDKKVKNYKNQYTEEKRWKHDLFYDYKYDEYVKRDNKNHNKTYHNYNNNNNNNNNNNKFYVSKNKYDNNKKNDYNFSYKNYKERYYYDKGNRIKHNNSITYYKHYNDIRTKVEIKRETNIKNDNKNEKVNFLTLDNKTNNNTQKKKHLKETLLKKYDDHMEKITEKENQNKSTSSKKEKQIILNGDIVIETKKEEEYENIKKGEEKCIKDNIIHEQEEKNINDVSSKNMVASINDVK